MLTKENLISFGIRQGDLLVVSSDITGYLLSGYRDNGVMPDVNELIDLLYNAVGNDGTLVIPTFTWDFCSGKTFDWRTTEGKVGLLGNVALRRNDFKRTKHPLYSFMVKGKYQKVLCDMNNTDSFGADSPFAFFDEHQAKTLLFGITLQEGYTFAHYVEQLGKPPYRYIKNFTAPYIDENGIEENRTYSMFVRKLDQDVTSAYEELENYLLELGVSKRFVVDEIAYTVIDMHASLKPILDDVLYNRSRKFCRYKDQNN